VERLANDRWRVIAEDLVTNTANAECYDAVIVCNGHNALPFTPDIPGMDGFVGDQIHSHDYRTPERFKDANVLIIGSGPSGIDICGDVAKVANQVGGRTCAYTTYVFIRAFREKRVIQRA